MQKNRGLGKMLRRPKKVVHVDMDVVDNALERGVKWLESKQNDNGSIGLKRWEIWDTVNAVLAMISAGTHSKSIENAVNFILDGQMDDGGFFYEFLPPSRKDLAGKYVYCIEATSVALIALYGYERRITAEIKNGIDFLLEKQRECGGWELPFLFHEPHEIDLESNYYPSVTGYALQPLLHTNIFSTPVLKRALKFLKKTQHSNGSWGSSIHYYSTEGYAIKNISNALVLMKAKVLNWSYKDRSKIDRMLGSCIKYTKRMQNADGSWSIEGSSTESLSTSLFLQSLLNTNEKSFIGLGMNWLLKKQQRDGFWKGGELAGTNIDTFVTSEALLALCKYKGYLNRE
jgi:squalene cyclase